MFSHFERGGISQPEEITKLGYLEQSLRRFKVSSLIDEPSDIFISMIDNGDTPIDFLSRCSKARFKIGRHDYEGHAYNMIVSGSSGEDLRPEARDIFAKIKEMLTKIE